MKAKLSSLMQNKLNMHGMSKKETFVEHISIECILLKSNLCGILKAKIYAIKKESAFWRKKLDDGRNPIWSEVESWDQVFRIWDKLGRHRIQLFADERIRVGCWVGAARSARTKQVRIHLDGRLLSAEEAFLLPTQQPQVWIPALPRFFIFTV